MPAFNSDLATLSAPCLVRVNTSVRVQAVSCSQCVSSRSFCCWSTKNTDCRIVSTVARRRARRARRPDRSATGRPTREWPAACVAENSSVCRLRGTLSTIRRRSWMKPMSSIRSASSRISTSTCDRSTKPCCIRSSSRPGVATRMSTPAFKARTCGDWPTPPKIDRLPQAGMAAVGLKTLADLQRQLARGREHQGADLASAAVHAAFDAAQVAARSAGRTRPSCRCPSGHSPARRGLRGSAEWRRPESWWRWRSPARQRRGATARRGRDLRTSAFLSSLPAVRPRFPAVPSTLPSFPSTLHTVPLTMAIQCGHGPRQPAGNARAVFCRSSLEVAQPSWL